MGVEVVDVGTEESCVLNTFISKKKSSTEHLSIYSLVIYSLDKCQFKSFVHFKIGLLVFSVSTCKGPLYILVTAFYEIHDL